MNTLHSPFSAPRKELNNSLQKSVVALLFILLLAFVAMYALMSINLDKQNAEQERLSELLAVVHSAEEHWLEWLLIEDRQIHDEKASESSTPDQLYQLLVSEYSVIQTYLESFDVVKDKFIVDSLALLDLLSKKNLDSQPLTPDERVAIYSSFERLESIDDSLLQISVNLDYQRQVFVERLIWVPVAIFLLITLIIVTLAIRFARQLTSGFATLHYVVDHYKNGHASPVLPRKMVDEFTDLSHLVDNELASRDFDLDQQNENINLIEKALNQVKEPFFVTNHHGDVVWLSSGAERLWFRNISFFESLFGIDSGLDDLIGERIADSILESDQPLKLELSDGVYWLNVQHFSTDSEAEEESLQCFISIQTRSDLSELDVLHHSLKLMEQDVWNSPIRVLRKDSPYAGFAKSLEVVRCKVIALFDVLNSVSTQTNMLEKITKLQQIASLIDDKTNHNEQSINHTVKKEAAPLEGFQIELNDMAWLSEQVRDSLILGYELVLQRLALVEKDLSSDVFLLSDVERCLNEVRAGVLSSLAAAEGESEIIRRRFAVDLEHDISKVQEQIEEMKSMATSTLTLLESDRSVGGARLDRARESINEMLDRIHALMTKTSSGVSEDVSGNASIQKTNDGQQES
ncbi:hypothetical protein C0J08_16200 [Marinomonas sp. CT5]|uniref:hypothetical protein n=1 Tax=Marinomonas sp. CT5 TaxID=2066133 RepID=UPI001BB049D5|nr:hypothetical protein [Marinomonas sp. CT5]QUX96843.1 hypothetical protein C0J08_16200 [Marinomonas sp. CT5]